MVLMLFSSSYSLPLQQMFFEGSFKFHKIIQPPEFLWDLIKYFNARGPPCALIMPVEHELYIIPLPCLIMMDSPLLGFDL